MSGCAMSSAAFDGLTDPPYWMRTDDAAASPYFSATWCIPCEELELTFGDDDVYNEIMASFVPLKIDVSRQDDEDQKKRDAYDSKGELPSVILVAPDGIELGRVEQMMEPDAFLEVLRPAVDKLRAKNRSALK